MSNAKTGTSGTGNLKSSLSALAKAAGGDSRVAEPSAWTLPSGEDLLHYALNGGFLAPGILGSTKDSLEDGRSRQSRSEQSLEEVR